MSFTKWWGRHGHTILKCLLFVLVGAMGVLLVLLAWINIKCVQTDNTGFEADSTNFTLYKNTRFRECSTTTTVSVNCTVLFWQLQQSYEARYIEYIWEEQQYLSQSHLGERSLTETTQGLQTPGAKYDWCTLTSCLRDYKVIPSEPYDSAFAVTGMEPLRVWNNINEAALFGLLLVRTLFLTRKHEPEDCMKSRSFFDLALWGPMFVMLILWIYNFIKFAMAPEHAAPLSIIAWLAIWHQAVAVLHCPFACRYYRSKRPKIIASILFFIAFAQWLASIYVAVKMPLLHGTPPQVRYQCLKAEILKAPGKSICSPQQICAKDWLFTNSRFKDLTNDWNAWEIAGHYPAIFIFGSFVAWGVPLMLFFNAYVPYWRGEQQYPGLGYKMRTGFKLLVILSLSVMVVVCVINAKPALSAIMRKDTMNREAVIAFDRECTAVHVTLSDWRYFLDVSEYNRAWRIAKMWLNA